MMVNAQADAQKRRQGYELQGPDVCLAAKPEISTGHHQERVGNSWPCAQQVKALHLFGFQPRAPYSSPPSLWGAIRGSFLPTASLVLAFSLEQINEQRRQ